MMIYAIIIVLLDSFWIRKPFNISNSMLNNYIQIAIPRNKSFRRVSKDQSRKKFSLILPSMPLI